MLILYKTMGLRIEIEMRPCTVELDLIVTEMLVFPSKSSRNENDSDPTIVTP